jgi:hypothetical protein
MVQRSILLYCQAIPLPTFLPSSIIWGKKLVVPQKGMNDMEDL